MADETSAIRRLIRQGLEEIGLETAESSVEQLAGLAELVADWGSRMNLTGHRNANAVASHLVLDAAALEGVLPPALRVADLGSGAGFPGLPLAILRRDREVFLVESRERRHHFQRQAIRQLGITNASAIRGRFDEIEPVPCDLVVAQAVASKPELVEGMLRWCRSGGFLAIPERAGSRLHRDQAGLGRTRHVAYQVPLSGPQRYLWLAEVL